MTLRDLIPDFWCKLTWCFTEYCQNRFGVQQYEINWLDFTIWEAIFALPLVCTVLLFAIVLLVIISRHSLQIIIKKRFFFNLMELENKGS